MLQLICFLFVTHLTPPDTWKTYNDTLGRYTIQYPANWETTTADKAVGFLSPQDGGTDLFRENVNVIVQDLSAQPLTLKQYTDLSKKQYTDTYGATAVVSVKDTTISGIPAEVGLFAMRAAGVDLRLKQCWFLKNNAAYLLTYTAEPDQFSRFLPTAMKVMASFKLLK